MTAHVSRMCCILTHTHTRTHRMEGHCQAQTEFKNKNGGFWPGAKELWGGFHLKETPSLSSCVRLHHSRPSAAHIRPTTTLSAVVAPCLSIPHHSPEGLLSSCRGTNSINPRRSVLLHLLSLPSFRHFYWLRPSWLRYKLSGPTQKAIRACCYAAAFRSFVFLVLVVCFVFSHEACSDIFASASPLP